MRQRAFFAAGAIAVPIAVLTIVRCATPTSIVVQVYSDIPCGEISVVRFWGVPGTDANALVASTAADSGSPYESSQVSCTQTTLNGKQVSYWGSVVLLPKQYNAVSFAVAARLGGDPGEVDDNGVDVPSCVEQCAGSTAATCITSNCVVESRTNVQFSSGVEDTLSILLPQICVDHYCPQGMTCGATGQCVPAVTVCDAGTCGTSDAGPFDASTSCQNYCNQIAAICSGLDNQYVDMTTCQSMCANLPNDPDSGATLACRIGQLGMALSTNDASAFCPSAGPYGGDPCGPQWESFCHLDSVPCNGNYPTNDVCESYSAPDANLSAQAPGNAQAAGLPCREYQLELAYADAAQCPAAGLDGGGVCP
jgi:hypothetical protein